ncbi:SDR family NAD(P)-dependent oxidoreductase [Actinoplanes sp. NPDC049265]|uniref:SDR family NAD(P)-dependent oxidoreductase n=1 Tax=Actinoplanes sp. NPDC049265 TaxID=3363902 RepID=UPI003711DCCB
MTAPAPPPTHRDRIAVVTGAAQGIGQAVSRQLAARGATVVAVERNEPAETCALIEEAGHPVVGLRADVADPDQTARVGEQVRSRFGRCHILVNNAGIYPFRTIDDLDYATWRRVLAVNLDSYFVTGQTIMADGGLVRL